MKIMIVRTRMGGEVRIAMADANFQGLMKAVRSDGMLLSDTFMCPFDAIDSCFIAEVADNVGTADNVHQLHRPPFPPKPNETPGGAA